MSGGFGVKFLSCDFSVTVVLGIFPTQELADKFVHHRCFGDSYSVLPCTTEEARAINERADLSIGKLLGGINASITEHTK